MLFKAQQTGPAAKLTNWRSSPASMTQGTVSDLDSNEWVLHVRRNDNVRSMHKQFIGPIRIRPVKGRISTRIMGEITTQLTLEHLLCST